MDLFYTHKNKLLSSWKCSTPGYLQDLRILRHFIYDGTIVGSMPLCLSVYTHIFRRCDIEIMHRTTANTCFRVLSLYLNIKWCWLDFGVSLKRELWNSVFYYICEHYNLVYMVYIWSNLNLQSAYFGNVLCSRFRSLKRAYCYAIRFAVSTTPPQYSFYSTETYWTYLKLLI